MPAIWISFHNDCNVEILVSSLFQFMEFITNQQLGTDTVLQICTLKAQGNLHENFSAASRVFLRFCMIPGSFQVSSFLAKWFCKSVWEKKVSVKRGLLPGISIHSCGTNAVTSCISVWKGHVPVQEMWGCLKSTQGPSATTGLTLKPVLLTLLGARWEF